MNRNIYKQLNEIRGAVQVLGGFCEYGKTFQVTDMFIASSPLQRDWELGLRLGELQEEYMDAEGEEASGLVLGGIDEKINGIIESLLHRDLEHQRRVWGGEKN